MTGELTRDASAEPRAGSAPESPADPVGAVCAIGGGPRGAKWLGPDLDQRRRIVGATRTVAMLGASANESRASYFAATYLLSSTEYEIYFVNPFADEILGRPVYRTLADLPVVPDLVDVFRRPQDLPEALAETLEVGAKTFWLQLGLWDDALALRAEAAGLEVVMDRCLKIEHARFHGGLHLAGFDTGVIDSRRW